MSKDISGLFPTVSHDPDPELGRSAGDCVAEPESGQPAETAVFDRNISRLAERYPLSKSGYFGTKGSGKGTATRVREIYSDDPIAEAVEFFRVLTEGGSLKNSSNDKITLVTMPDKSIVSLRIDSKSGPPAVGINNIGGNPKLKPDQKIHFVKKGSGGKND